MANTSKNPKAFEQSFGGGSAPALRDEAAMRFGYLLAMLLAYGPVPQTRAEDAAELCVASGSPPGF